MLPSCCRNASQGMHILFSITEHSNGLTLEEFMPVTMLLAAAMHHLSHCYSQQPCIIQVGVAYRHGYKHERIIQQHSQEGKCRSDCVVSQLQDMMTRISTTRIRGAHVWSDHAVPWLQISADSPKRTHQSSAWHPMISSSVPGLAEDAKFSRNDQAGCVYVRVAGLD
jgi:hypothetical protein